MPYYVMQHLKKLRSPQAGIWISNQFSALSLSIWRVVPIKLTQTDLFLMTSTGIERSLNKNVLLRWEISEKRW